MVVFLLVVHQYKHQLRLSASRGFARRHRLGPENLIKFRTFLCGYPLATKPAVLPYIPDRPARSVAHLSIADHPRHPLIKTQDDSSHSVRYLETHRRDGESSI